MIYEEITSFLDIYDQNLVLEKKHKEQQGEGLGECTHTKHV